jgi:hypothetical protein
VKVPANAGCVPADEARARGINIALMTAKGFEFTTIKTSEPIVKAPEAGDECTMDDGGVGTFSNDNDGNLVCMPVEEESAKAIRDLKAKKAAGEITAEEFLVKFKEIMKANTSTGDGNDPSEDTLWESTKAEHDFHEKAVKGHLKEYVEACKAEAAKDKPADGASEDDTKAYDARVKAASIEHEKKLKTVLKAEHDRHIKCLEKCVKAYHGGTHEPEADPNANDDGDNEKMIAELVKGIPADTVVTAELMKALLIKAAATMHESIHKKLTELHEKFAEGHDQHEKGSEIHQDAIDDFKALLEAHKPAEGNDDDGKGAASPEKRSIPADQTLDLNDEDLRGVLQATQTAVKSALTLMKEKSRERDRRNRS